MWYVYFFIFTFFNVVEMLVREIEWDTYTYTYTYTHTYTQAVRTQFVTGILAFIVAQALRAYRELFRYESLARFTMLFLFLCACQVVLFSSFYFYFLFFFFTGFIGSSSAANISPVSPCSFSSCVRIRFFFRGFFIRGEKWHAHRL
jgi:hypothetical protein